MQAEQENPREEQAQHALSAFRERRRQRRGEDTYFGSVDCLIGGPDTGERESRREEVLAHAGEDGMPPELAGELFDVAREEGLDPALGYELVRSGLGVRPPAEGISNAPAQPSADPYVPEWLEQPLPPDELLRERMLRISFRRLRKMLEGYAEVEDAFRAFAREPDVSSGGY